MMGNVSGFGTLVQFLLLCCLLILQTTKASVFLQEVDGNEGQCIDPNTKKAHANGESWSAHAEGMCASITCGVQKKSGKGKVAKEGKWKGTEVTWEQTKYMQHGAGCGMMMPLPDCHMGEIDLTKPYPDCCPQMVCPQWEKKHTITMHHEDGTITESTEEPEGVEGVDWMKVEPPTEVSFVPESVLEGGEMPSHAEERRAPKFAEERGSPPTMPLPPLAPGGAPGVLTY